MQLSRATVLLLLSSFAVACSGTIMPPEGTYTAPGTGFLPPTSDTPNPTSVAVDPNTLKDPNATSMKPSNPTSPSGSNNPTPPADPSKPAPVDYSSADLMLDVNTVLQAHPPVYSTENLGNPANVALWNQAAVDSLYRGLVVAQANYYPMLKLKDLAHLLLALAGTDSTGNYNLDNGSTGLLSVSTNVSGEFSAHANAVTDSNGIVVADPANLVLTNPGANVGVFAWSSRNSISAGESTTEIALGEMHGNVFRDVGNGIMAWVCGANTDRHRNPQTAGCPTDTYPGFHNRVEDYFVQANFGSVADFETILNAPVPNTLVNFKDAPTSTFP